MNVKRFQARTSKDALAQARQFFGDDAVVLSTRPCAQGVELMAMSADAVHAVTTPSAGAVAEAVAPSALRRAALPAPRTDAERPRAAPAVRTDAGDGADGVHGDVQDLAMSTLSFQDYVRERMLRKRHESLQVKEETPPPVQTQATPPTRHAADPLPAEASPGTGVARAAGLSTAELRSRAQARASQMAPEPGSGLSLDLSGRAARAARETAPELLNELRAMKGLIEERFGTMAWLDKVHRAPEQVRLMQQMLGSGYSPALVRKVIDSLPADHPQDKVGDWAQQVLAHNLQTDEQEAPIEDRGGVYALIGSTGVGKTTTTAKLAAAFALRHGPANLGLVTLDAYRVGAHDQLRAYGRILNVAVHIAHDEAALQDLLGLLSTKKMVLIDTVGLAQRDARTREMLNMLKHDSIRKLLVINAASQGETIDDVMNAYRSTQCAGVVLSKVDEAVKIGPALDAALRRKARLVGVANGQRVPEDWQRANAQRLVRRSLGSHNAAAFELDSSEAGLMFSLRSESMRVSGGGLHA